MENVLPLLAQDAVEWKTMNSDIFQLRAILISKQKTYENKEAILIHLRDNP